MAVPKEKTPNRMNRAIFLFALAIMLNALLNHSLANKPELLKIGDKLPQFQGIVMGGGNIKGSDFTGKPTVFFFYANWCPCSHETVEHVKIAGKDYAKDGLAVIGVGIQDSRGNLEKFAERHKLDFPVIVDGGDDIARSMGVRTTPTTIFVGSDGVVKSIFVGKVEQFDQLADGLESILEKEIEPV